jgi:2-(3-amino-3-carboxypropyl)histidine synthase
MSTTPSRLSVSETAPGGLPSATAGTFRDVGPELFDALRKAGYRKIVVQVPAGLVRNAHELVERIRDATGAKVSLLARACFGACDLPSPDEAPGVDAAVVLGHAPIPNVRRALPTYFVELRDSRGDVEAIGDQLASSSVPRRLGLVASIQHLDLLEPLRDALRERGFAAEVASGDNRLAYPGQALGCNYTGAENLVGSVDAFLFLGTGQFHPVGLAYAVDRPVYAYDPVRSELEPPIDRAALVRARQLLVARCLDAQRFGVLVSSFVGQDRSSMAQVLVRKIREHGKEAEVLLFGRLDPQDLIGRNLDAYVNTACPRIALDDAGLYPRPMLTPPELLMVLGEHPLEPYRFDTYH